MTDVLIDLHKAAPSYQEALRKQQEAALAQLNNQSNSVATTQTGTSTKVTGDGSIVLVDPNIYNAYSDPNARPVISTKYRPPQWKEGETIHNFGSVNNSQQVRNPNSRFNVALKQAQISEDAWLRMPFDVKQEIIRDYAAQDYSYLSPQVQAQEGNIDRYTKKIMRAYGVSEDDRYDSGYLTPIADGVTEMAGGAVRGLNTLVSAADWAQNKVGIDIDLGVQKALGETTKVLQDMVSDEEVLSKREYFGYLLDNNRFGEAVALVSMNPALMVNLVGPEVASMIVGTKGIGKLFEGIKLVPGAQVAADKLSKFVEYLGSMGKGSGAVKSVLGSPVRGASKVLLKGAEYKTAAAIQEAGGFRLEQYLKGVDVRSPDVMHAFELAFLQQYITQGLLPGTADSIAYKILNSTRGGARTVGAKTLNEIKEFVKKADEGNILKRFNNTVQRMGGVGSVVRAAGTVAREGVEEGITGTYQDLLSQNIDRIYNVFHPEFGKHAVGSLSHSTVLDGNWKQAGRAGAEGSIIGMFMGLGGHIVGDGNAEVKAYKSARHTLAETQAEIDSIDTSNYTPLATQRSSADIYNDAATIEAEFATGDYTRMSDYQALMHEAQSKVVEAVAKVSSGNVTPTQARQIMDFARQNAESIQNMQKQIAEAQVKQNAVSPEEALRGPLNNFAKGFDKKRNVAGYEESDAFVFGIPDLIRGMTHPDGITAAENKLAELQASPLMVDPKVQDMVVELQNAIDYAKDPQSYFNAQVQAQQSTQQNTQQATQQATVDKAKVTAYKNDVKTLRKDLPPSLITVLDNPNSTPTDILQASQDAITELLNLSQQNATVAPDLAAYQMGLAYHLQESNNALLDLDQFNQVKQQRYLKEQAAKSQAEQDAIAKQQQEEADRLAQEQAAALAEQSRLAQEKIDQQRKLAEEEQKRLDAEAEAQRAEYRKQAYTQRKFALDNWAEQINDAYKAAGIVPDATVWSGKFSDENGNGAIYKDEVADVVRGLIINVREALQSDVQLPNQVKAELPALMGKLNTILESVETQSSSFDSNTLPKDLTDRGISPNTMALILDLVDAMASFVESGKGKSEYRIRGTNLTATEALGRILNAVKNNQVAVHGKAGDAQAVSTAIYDAALTLRAFISSPDAPLRFDIKNTELLGQALEFATRKVQNPNAKAKADADVQAVLRGRLTPDEELTVRQTPELLVVRLLNEGIAALYNQEREAISDALEAEIMSWKQASEDAETARVQAQQEAAELMAKYTGTMKFDPTALEVSPNTPTQDLLINTANENALKAMQPKPEPEPVDKTKAANDQFLKEFPITGTQTLDISTKAVNDRFGGLVDLVTNDELITPPKPPKPPAPKGGKPTKKSPSSGKKGKNQLDRRSEDATTLEHRQTAARYGGKAAYEAAKREGRTELTYEQWVQVRTPSFKAWFGDWENSPETASKMVNPVTGEPQVYYHGTPKGDGVTRSYDRLRDNTFATPDKELAEFYRTKYGQTGSVLEIFINARSVGTVDFEGKLYDDSPYGTQRVGDLLVAHNAVVQTTDGGTVNLAAQGRKSAFVGLPEPVIEKLEDRLARYSQATGKQYTERGRTYDANQHTGSIANVFYKSGADAVVFENVIDVDNSRGRASERLATTPLQVVAVSNGANIKSATHDSGAYDVSGGLFSGSQPLNNLSATDVQNHVAEKGLPETLRELKKGFHESDPRQTTLDGLLEIVDDNVIVRFEDLSEQGKTGYYDIETNTIVLDENSRETDIDLVHELTHAYTVYALENPQALSEEQRAVVDEIRRAWTQASQNPEIAAAYPTILDPQTGVHEFVAELMSNPKFQTLYDKAFANKAPQGFFGSVRAFFRRIAELLGLSRKQAMGLQDLMMNTASLFAPNDGRVTSIEGLPHLDRKVIRQVIFTPRAPEQNQGDQFVGLATMETDGTWSLSWTDTQGVQHNIDNQTYQQVETRAQAIGLVPRHRSSANATHRALVDVADMAYNHSGLLYSFIRAIQRFLPPVVSEPLTRRIDTLVRWGANNLNNHYSWITTLENIARNAYGASIPVEVETRINRLKQRGAAELEHYGVGNKINFRDHMDILHDLAKRSGMSKTQLDDLAYALRAPHFIRRKLRNSGKADPYYKGRDLLANDVTGFQWYKVNGKWSETGTPQQLVKDDDGSQFMAQLTPQQRQFAKEFEKAIIAMNNNTLDFQLAMGAIDQATYNDLYGEFYVPLQSGDTEAKAFAGRIKGRSTKAANILGKYVANSQARINQAVESAIMREAADLLEQYPMPHMARLQSDELKSQADKTHLVYAPEGVLDGRSKAFYRDGKRQRIVLADPVFSRSLAKANALQRDGMMSTFIRASGVVTRWLSLSRTVMSPTFHIVSFIRDVTVSLVNTQAASRGKLSATEAAQLSARIVPRMIMVLPRLLKAGVNEKNAHFSYRIFRNEGGINPMAHYDLDKVTNDLDLLAFNSGTVRAKVVTAGNKAMQLMHFSDNAARYAAWYEYLKMRNGGLEFESERQLLEFIRRHPDAADIARDLSKNLTGNFEQKGSDNTPRAFFMFWNAIMGGIKTTYNIVNPKYGTYGLKMLGLLALVVAMQAANDDEEDEDGTPMWKRMSEGVGQFHIGDFKFNAGQELLVPLNMAREMVRVATGQSTVNESSHRVMRAVQESIMPFQTPDTDDTLFNIVYGITPTMWQPIVSQAFNKDYFGRPLVPEKAYDQEGKMITNPMDHQRRGTSDSLVAEWMSHTLAKLGIADTAPGSWDTWVNHYLGGGGKFVVDTIHKVRTEGKDPVSAMLGIVEKKFSTRYNEFAIKDDFEKEYLRLSQRMSMGEHFDALINLDARTDRDALAKWYGSVQNKVRELRSSEGKSASQLFTERKQLQLQLIPPSGEILDINAQLEEINAKAREIYLDALVKLREMADSYE